MSYLDKLKKSLEKTENKKIPEVKPGWIILNKEKYMISNDKEEENQNSSHIINENKNSIEINKTDYEEDFYIKYGDILLDFFMDMRDDYKNNCYNILDKKEYGTTCFSYDFERFIMRNTKMVNDEENASSFSDDEENREEFY